MTTKERFFSYLKSGGSFAFTVDGVSYCIDACGYSKTINGKQHSFRYSICPFNVNDNLAVEGEYNSVDELLDYKLVNGNRLRDHMGDMDNLYQIVYA